MNAFDQYTLSPGALASFTEPTPDLQRNYRTRGMMDGIGKSDDAGRWKYSLCDLVSIWISDRLSMHGRAMDRRIALRRGVSLAQTVINGALKNYRGIPLGHPRYMVILSDGFSDDGRVHGQSLKEVSGLHELDADAFDQAEIIDIHRLAKTIPVAIMSLLIVAHENEFDDIGLPGLVEGLAD